MKVYRLAGALCLVALCGCGKHNPTQAVIASPDAAARAAAAARLGRGGANAGETQRDVAALSKATADPDDKVRLAAITALGDLRTPESRTALLQVVRGQQYSRAALVEYQAVADLYPDNLDVLNGLAKAQIDLNELPKAEENLNSMWAITQNLDPTQIGQHVFGLQSSLDQLAARYTTEKQPDAAKRVQAVAKQVGEFIAKLPPEAFQGGMGGMWGGMQNIQMP